MKHHYQASLSSIEANCLVCGYPELSHGANATCEACGLSGICEFEPDERNPRKILLCLECYEKERKVRITRAITPDPGKIMNVYAVKTAGDYFNANIPAIMEICQSIDSDESVSNKSYEKAKRVKLHIESLSRSLFELDKQRASVANEQRDAIVFFNHQMKELSIEKQAELGLKDITYKQEKAPKKIKVPTVKKFDKNELRRVAAENNIEEFMLQGIVTARKVSLDEAVRIYNEVTKK